jgi:Holliday junction DNA helicase RuvA
LCGRLLEKKPPWLLVDVAGVGYEVESPMSTIYDLPEPGAEVTLLTHLVVREDAHHLYAFLTEAERGLFRELIKVNGVGARMGLAILSSMNPSEFRHCILHGNSAALVRIPGVGKKTAERLVVEMRDRIEKGLVSGKIEVGMHAVEPAADPVNEALQALVALGYKPQDASRMVAAVEGQHDSSKELIRLALKAAL